jgi:hypothetical protein
MKQSTLVEDLSGFNFIENPFQENTHIFECLDGYYICESPEEGSRFKYQQVLRKASADETALHKQVVPTPKSQILLALGLGIEIQLTHQISDEELEGGFW